MRQYCGCRSPSGQHAMATVKVTTTASMHCGMVRPVDNSSCHKRRFFHTILSLWPPLNYFTKTISPMLWRPRLPSKSSPCILWSSCTLMCGVVCSAHIAPALQGSQKTIPSLDREVGLKGIWTKRYRSPFVILLLLLSVTATLLLQRLMYVFFLLLLYDCRYHCHVLLSLCIYQQY